jgi:RNA polymerase sigma factor (sigma-70 family)
MSTSSPPLATSLAPDALRQALLANRAHALTQLYRQGFPPVRRYVGRHGGNAQDAQDVFQDALVLLYEQATSGTLTLTASATTYLGGISRNLWQHELRRRARLPHQPLSEDWVSLASEETPADPTVAVLNYIERLGAKCKGLLLSFYYFQQPLTQIAEVYGYRSVRSATVQKFKCLERLRHAVRGAYQAATSDY